MNPRKILRIARWEVTKNAGGLDRRTAAVAVLAVALLLVVAPLVAFGGVGLDDGLYRVAVDEDSPYYAVVESDDTFELVGSAADASHEDLRDGSVELLIPSDGAPVPADSQKGIAAYDELRDSVERYNNLRLRAEENQTAAFPVEVVLEFERQEEVPDFGDRTVLDEVGPGDIDPGDGTGTDPGETDSGTGSGETDSGDGTGTDSDGSGAGSEETDFRGAGSGESDPSGEDETVDGGTGPLGGLLSEGQVSGSPAEITPPFPFQSLVLAFLFVIPLNFLIQAYGSTILTERLNRRGELLLVSPVSRIDIIAGKTLPYFLAAILVETVLAVGLVYLIQGSLGGLVSVLALTPLVLLFLGATFLGAMFARSFKELTFVTVTITVGLTTYAFVPAIFTDVTPIALISPLTLVVLDLQNEAISLAEVVFSTTPPLLVALVLFGLGSGLYREEDMFDQRSLSGRVLDSLAVPLTRRWHVGVMTMVLVPFVFVAQLLAIALLFALGDMTIAVVLLLVVVAVTEELAKSLHIYASYEHGRFDRTAKTALVLGLASGVGFFLAEKIALLAQLVGLGELDLGQAGLLGSIPLDPGWLLFLLAPLTLHVVTAAISAVGASRDSRSYVVAVGLAMILHFSYNMLVVTYYVW